MSREHQSRFAHLVRNRLATHRLAETGSAVPDSIVGEQRCDIVGDSAQTVIIDDGAPRVPLVYELSISGLEIVDREHVFGTSDPSAESGDLSCQVLICGQQIPPRFESLAAPRLLPLRH